MPKFLIMLLLPLLFASSYALPSGAKEPITEYSVLFSPDDHVAEELISLIDKEKKSVKAAVYCLMHRGIAQALINAHRRGVSVEVIVDKFSLKSRSPLKRMAAAEVPIYVWNMPPKEGAKGKKGGPLMHDKFCILGDDKVWTGSFNFTFEAATANRENVVILENAAVAESYREEFERLKKLGCAKYTQTTSKFGSYDKYEEGAVKAKK